MQVNLFNSTNSFKGCDARDLKGLICTDKNAIGNLPEIVQPLGIDIYYPNPTKLSQRRNYETLLKKNQVMWAQDYLTVLRGKHHILFYDRTRNFLSNFLNPFAKELEEKQGFMPIKLRSHLRGGNFFVCLKDGKRILLINEGKNIYSEEDFKTFYGVAEVISLPSIDYHLDLFLRPLDNGNILVSDINKTREGLLYGQKYLKEFLSSHNLKEEQKSAIENIIKNISNELVFLEATQEYDDHKRNPQNLEKAINILKGKGFNPIRVPAAYYRLKMLKSEEKIKEREKELDEEIQHTLSIAKSNPCFTPDSIERIKKRLYEDKMEKMNDPMLGVEAVNDYFNNFANAIVHKKDGELHYITNAPLLDKHLGITPETEKLTGFSTKNLFLESISPYIKKENVHFIDDKTTHKLFDLCGGIHCAVAEVVK